MSGQLRLGGIRRIKKHNILALIILALVVRLFFSVVSSDKVLAKDSKEISNGQKFSSIDPLKNINLENLFEKSEEKKASYNKTILKKDKGANNKQEEIYNELVKGYPLAVMTLEISKQDKSVAAFLIAIAKKEWGGLL